jgi:hypothetical protein
MDDTKTNAVYALAEAGGDLLSWPLRKLLGPVVNAVGIVYEPTRIRRLDIAKADGVRAMAAAEGDAMVTQAKADAEAKAVKAEAEAKAKLLKLESGHEIRVKESEYGMVIMDLEERAAERKRRSAVRQQENMEAVIEEAAKVAGEMRDEEANEKPVEEDWLHRFFHQCENVGDEQMRKVWGHILAKESAKPGSFSYRALAIVNLMSRADAELFTKFCSTVIGTNFGGPYSILFDDVNEKDGLRRIITLEQQVRLESLGLIAHAGFGGAHYKHTFQTDQQLTLSLHYHGQSRVLKKKGPTDLRRGAFMLTDVGSELLTITTVEPDYEFFDRTAVHFTSFGWEVSNSDFGTPV